MNFLSKENDESRTRQWAHTFGTIEVNREGNLFYSRSCSMFPSFPSSPPRITSCREILFWNKKWYKDCMILQTWNDFSNSAFSFFATVSGKASCRSEIRALCFRIKIDTPRCRKFVHTKFPAMTLRSVKVLHNESLYYFLSFRSSWYCPPRMNNFITFLHTTLYNFAQKINLYWLV